MEHADGDCYQARVVFDRGTPDEHQMHIDMYYSRPDSRGCVFYKHGGHRETPPYDSTGPARPDKREKWGLDMLKNGAKIAFAPWADGKGYDMEVFWPWTAVRTSGKPLALAHGRLWALLPGYALFVVDPKTGKVLERRETDGLAALTDRNGRLYALHAPAAKRISFALPQSGKTFTVVSSLPADGSRFGDVYLNGVKLEKPLIRHSQILSGGILEFR